MTRDLLLQGVLAGVFATVVMDLSLLVGKVTRFVGPAFPMPVGRWISHALRGRLRHRTILDTPPVPAEGPFTLVAHYIIGTTLGLFFVLHVAPRGFGPPFLVALGYGIATGVFPWLLMFPGMGFGLFGRRGPPEARLFRNSLYTHVGFGLGLAVWTTWIHATI